MTTRAPYDHVLNRLVEQLCDPIIVDFKDVFEYKYEERAKQKTLQQFGNDLVILKSQIDSIQRHIKEVLTTDESGLISIRRGSRLVK